MFCSSVEPDRGMELLKRILVFAAPTALPTPWKRMLSIEKRRPPCEGHKEATQAQEHTSTRRDDQTKRRRRASKPMLLAIITVAVAGSGVVVKVKLLMVLVVPPLPMEKPT
jgi:hypothetical protein